MFSEVITKDRIAIPQQVVRELVKGRCLAELLSNPLRGRVGGHIEVQNAATIMGLHQKDVKDLKRIVGTVKKSMDTNCLA